MNSKIKRLILLIVGFLGFIIPIATSSTSSAWSGKVYEQKALGYGIYNCYNKSTTVIPAEIQLDNVWWVKDIVATGYKIPTIDNHKNTVECQNVLLKELQSLNLNESIYDNANKKASILTNLGYKPNNKGTCFRIKSAYEAKETMSIDEMHEAELHSHTAWICSSDGTVNKDSISVIDNDEIGLIKVSKHDKTLSIKVFMPGGDGAADDGVLPYPLEGYNSFDDLRSRIISNLWAMLADKYVAESKGIEWDLYDVSYLAQDNGSTTVDFRHKDSGAVLQLNNMDMYETKELVTEYKIITANRNSDWRKQASFKATKNLVGLDANSESSYKFTQGEEIALYDYYLKVHYGATYACAHDFDDWERSKATLKDEKHGGVSFYKVYEGQKEECYVVPKNQKKSDKVFGVNKTTKLFDGTQLGFAEVVANADVANLDLDKLDLEALEKEIEEAEKEVVVEPDTGDGMNDGTGENAEPTCMNAGAAGSMAWILCPIGESMGSAMSGLYTNYIEPMLMVRSGELFQFDENQGSYHAWGVFRDIANVIFVLIFLVIVFSQLTGLGIDNYGIKKTLPKLVVVAIFVNLSYIICVLCVDTSNIVGNGIRGVFDSISVNVESDIKLEGSETPLLTASKDIAAGKENEDVKNSNNNGQNSNKAAKGMAIVAIVLLVGLIALFVDGVINDPATLIPLLLAALGALIGVLFLFVMLAARQAGIVCLVVVSPIIVVLYVLPNTKKYFDKVRDIFWKLLLVYPICGLLIGGGDFASRLLLQSKSTVNFFDLLVALAAGIAPIFFIPQVLTGALNALSGLGSRIQGLGNAMRRGAQNTVGNSRHAQEAKKLSAERAQRLQTARRSGIRYNPLTGRARTDANGDLQERNGLRQRIARSRFGEFMGMKDRMGAAREQYTDMYGKREKNQNTADDMRTAHAQLNTARDAEQKRLGTAMAGVIPTRSSVYQSMQEEKNADARALNQHGYVGRNYAQASAERQNANNAAEAKNDHPDAVKRRHVYDAEQIQKRNQVLAQNREGLTARTVESFQQELRSANVATEAQNEVIADKGINVRSLDANKVEAYQKVHGVQAENAIVAQKVADGVSAENQAQSVDSAMLDVLNKANAVQAANQKVATLQGQGISIDQQARSVDANLVEQFSQANAILGENLAVETRKSAAGGGVSVQDQAKSVESVASERLSQSADVIGKNRAINADGFLQASKSLQAATGEQLNANTRTMATNNAGGPALTNLANETQRMMNQRIETQAAEDAGVAATSYATALQNAANQRIRTQAAQDAGVAAVSYDNELQRQENARLQAEENEVLPVPRLEQPLAAQRAQSSYKMQEYRNASDQFNNQGKEAVQAALANTIRGTQDLASGIQAHAAMDTLFSKGNIAEVYDGMTRFVPSTLANDPYTTEIIEGAAASKNIVFKGYSKDMGKGNGRSLDAYIKDKDGLGKYLKDEVGDHAADNFTKDDWEHIESVTAKNGVATETIFTPAMMKNAAVSSATQNQRSQAAFVKMLKRHGNKATIGAQFGASDLSKLSVDVINAIGKGNLKGAIDSLTDEIKGTLSEPVKNALGL